MGLQHFSHEHPLVFIEQRSHESEKVNCSGCGEMVSGPAFSCMECGFYLDKQCAEAPSEMNHPFHRNHSLNLLKRIPYKSAWCNFCKEICENFVYHCSCNVDLHIKCALFSYNIGEKRIAEFQHIARIDPLISTENHTEKLKKAECFACWKPLVNSVYFSPDCGFYLHEKCVDLPAEINHLLHHQHPLILQFNHKGLSCKICPKTKQEGFVYCCSPCEFVLHFECAAIPTKLDQLYYHRKHPLTLQFAGERLPCQICQETPLDGETVYYFCSICKFVLHVGCVSLPPIIEDKIHHEHPFTLLRREVTLVCDACGTSGSFVPYICSTCNHIVHRKCISLPRIIQFYRHHHHIIHTYFLEPHDEFKTWECRMCFEEVDTQHGSYFCSKCNYIVHVNCALKNPGLYNVVDSIETDEAMELAFEQVTSALIRHFSHNHNLALSEDTKGYKQCDGCLLSISTSYYYCSQCDFFLHKSCAELPKKKHIWYHRDLSPFTLTSGSIFKCEICEYETSGFAYTCDKCKDRHCLRCVLPTDIAKCQGHEHPLPFYLEYEGLCNACGGSTSVGYGCKSCKFVLHANCIILPVTTQHKSDDHPFKLTYHDNNYPESHYCDICEEERNPNHWFYHCAICNNSAHPNCVLGNYSFIKLGSIYTKGDHRHPLTFVQKVHDYPECLICGKPCFDLALECKIGCNYIVHWECVKPFPLIEKEAEEEEAEEEEAEEEETEEEEQ